MVLILLGTFPWQKERPREAPSLDRASETGPLGLALLAQRFTRHGFWTTPPAMEIIARYSKAIHGDLSAGHPLGW